VAGTGDRGPLTRDGIYQLVKRRSPEDLCRVIAACTGS
jgi:hypothetical protein